MIVLHRPLDMVTRITHKYLVIFPSHPMKYYRCVFYFWILLRKIIAEFTELFWQKSKKRNFVLVVHVFFQRAFLHFDPLTYLQCSC